MIRINWLNKKAQASVELAILGTLILVAFGWALNYGLTLASQQKAKQEAFRRALDKAYERNTSVSYTLKKNDRIASTASGGYNRGQANSAGSSASVNWVMGVPGEQGSEDQVSMAYWRFNEQNPNQNTYGLPRVEKTSVGIDGSERTVLVPVSVYNDESNRTENYSSNVRKSESDGGITFVKTANITDATSGTAYMRYDAAVDEEPWDDETPDPEWSPQGSFSYSDSETRTFNVSRTMPHDTGTIIRGNQRTTIDNSCTDVRTVQQYIDCHNGDYSVIGDWTLFNNTLEDCRRHGGKYDANTGCSTDQYGGESYYVYTYCAPNGGTWNIAQQSCDFANGSTRAEDIADDTDRNEFVMCSQTGGGSRWDPVTQTCTW